MPPLNLEDTIAALATPPGVGGIAILRVSGKGAIPLAARFFRPSKASDLASARSHTIHHGHVADEKGEIVDEVLVSLFRAPRSYTGEDVVEVSCHGGLRLTRRILELLLKAGARHAEPGEFTKRAFLNGRIDLAQAEAVSDLIRAQSDAALQTALHQLQGKLSEKINSLKEELMKIYAHFEGSLDFPDEHLENYSEDEFLKRMSAVEDEIRKLISSFKKGLAMRDGILTVIVGRPNVGKSSLLNALLERERALVSPIPGTTRDAVEESIEIGGWTLRLVDTAGLGGVPLDEIEQMGVRKTQSYLQEAELLLFVVDGSSDWLPADEVVLQTLEGRTVLTVVNKADLPQRIDLSRINHPLGRSKPCIVSCLTGKGLNELEKRIEETLAEEGRVQESVTLMRLRHKEALEKSLELLRHSRKSLEEGLSTEFLLVDLKGAIDSLRELVGEVYSEDLLDVIFQEFCIGK